MKNSSNYINESVYNTNLKYVRLQNKTKELFFKCLDEERSLEYFSEELDKIWGKLDHSFLDKEIEEYKELIHENNMTMTRMLQVETKEEEKKTNDFIKLVSTAVIVGYERKLVKQKEKEYDRSLKSNAYQNDKQEYLKLKVQQYTDSIVPYYVHKTGGIRYVGLNTYASMIHNTNLTRSGWNMTLNDAFRLGNRYFYIPFHSFSCMHCVEHQGQILSSEEVMDLLNVDAEEQAGDILHPNCKCELLLYYDGVTEMEEQQYSDEELEEQYEIRQKVNSLTLKSERIGSDIKIQKSLGNQDEVDKLKQQRNKVNSQVRELKNSLPSEELKKQVTAINR